MLSFINFLVIPKFLSPLISALNGLLSHSIMSVVCGQTERESEFEFRNRCILVHSSPRVLYLFSSGRNSTNRYMAGWLACFCEV